MPKKYPYIFRSLRITNPENWETFKEICYKNFSDPQKELNKYIHKTVKTGNLQQVEKNA